MTIKICPLCEKDTVTDAVSTHEVEYKSVKKIYLYTILFVVIASQKQQIQNIFP